MELHNQEPTPFGDQDSVELQDAGASAPVANRGASRVLIADANGVVVLPAGTELGDLRVEGRDLVVIGEDGVRYVIPEGAIIVPQLVIGDVAIPPLNLAALLIGNEPQPAAGNPQSSGGNFASAVGPIQAAYGLGDLLPYTELSFPQPEEQEVLPGLVDRDPTITIITVDQPAGAQSATATVAEAGLPTRNGEPAGSNAAANSEAASGTIVFNSPDGVAGITINGAAFTGVGQTIVSPRGTLAITSYDPVSGTIGFTYTLTDNLLNATLADAFSFVITDPDGDSATATLTVSATDDGPTARNDTDAVPAGTYTAQTGNVITAVGTTSGTAGADTLGADNATITRIASNGVPANTDTTFDSAGNLQVAGQYGTLLIKADGSYSYTRAAGTPGGVNDVFSYTLTDSDGTASTATLTIAIADATPVITSVPPAGSFEAGTLVFESGLPSRPSEAPGTNAPANTETTSGTVTFTGGDAPLSATINGVVVAPGAVITVPGVGTLTVNTFDPMTGVITYTFTLADNTSGDNTGTTFNVVVTDVDGDTAPGTFTIAIFDDRPDAVDDFATQAGENLPVTVNVLANDIQGADSVQPSTVALVPGTLSGTGTLANNGNGTFTYTPGAGETGTVTFDYTIADGDGDTDRATVAITLAADSTPTIAVAGDNTVDEAALPARTGEPAGSNAASSDETAAGTIAITTGGDSLASLVINGVNVTAGGTVTTSKGVLTVSVTNGAYSYSYTLTDNTLSDPDSDTFNLVVTDSDGDPASTTLVIAIADDAPSATDDAAALASGTYGPVTGSVTANDTPGADGIVVIDYTGVTTGVAGAVVNGQYGTLTIGADGAFSYTRNPGTPGGVTDTFSYTIRDGDGDLDTANLVITIGDGGTSLDLPVAGTPGVTQVLEAGLPAGSNAAGNGEFASGTFTFTAPDGPAIVTIDGTPITTVGQTVAGAYGTLTITSIAAGSIGYTYELTVNTSGDTTFDDFAVVVSDQDGDSTPGTLRIDIVDDVPTANDDVDSVTEDGPLTATGNVITGTDVAVGADANGSDGVADVKGADGAVVTAVVFNPAGGGAAVAGTVGGSLAGTYGTLTLNADGSYSYVLNNANPLVQGLDSTETLTETFTYTLTDGDSDADTATLTITIVGSDDGIVITGLNPAGAEETVYEADLADGQSPDAAALTQTGSFNVAALDGISVISVGGAVVFTGGAFVPGQSISTGYGTLTITAVTPVFDAAGDVVSATVSYSYTLGDNTLTHTGANDAQLTDTFAVSVTDSDGTVGTDTVDITVVDDVIIAVDDMTTQAAADEGKPVTIDVLANDLGGADGKVAASVALVSGSLKLDGGTAAGTLVNNGDGTFTYNPASGESGTITFDYSVADGDGDTDIATVTIILAGDSKPSFKSADPVEVDEDGLVSANVDAAPLQSAPTETDGTESAIGSGTALFQFGNDVPSTLAGSAVLVDTPALDGQLVTLAGENVVFGIEGGALVGRAGSAAGTEVIRIALTTSATTATVGEVAYGYTVTLSQPVRHATAGTEDTDILSGVTIEVTDDDGDKTTGSFAVTVRDDVPTAVAGPALSVVESVGATAGVNLLANDTPGADGAVVSHVNLGSGFVAITSGTPVVGSPGSYSFVVAGKGTYVFNANGSWSFDPVPVNNVGGAGVDASFSYRITDGDSDASEATQTVTITDGADPQAGTDITLTVDDDDLSDGSSPAAVQPESDSGTITFTPGSDAIASIVFGTDLTTLDTSNLTWTRVSGTQIVGKDTGSGATIVTLDLVRSGDSVTVKATLSDNYDAHPTFTADDLKTLGFVNVIATDTDGDTATNKVNVAVSDDVPVLVGGHTDIVLSGTDLDGSGVFDYSIGADSRSSFSALNSDLTIALSGTVGATAISNQLVTWVSESASAAEFDFTFKYDSDPTNASNPLSDGSGTITFDKVAGTYSIVLDAPIQSYTTSQTSNTFNRVDYNLSGPASQSEYVVSQLGATNPIFVRFKGIEASNSFGTGDTTFNSGNTFQGAESYVTISGSSNGVSGDTIQGQGGEVLNVDLFSSDPGVPNQTTGYTAAPNAFATGITLRLDLVGNDTDFVVILKLADPDNPSVILATRAIVVDPADIYKAGDTIPTGYTLSSPLDSNDGFVIIESNDYNQGLEDFVIVGFQLVASTQGTTGTGIDLVRGTGNAGASTQSDTFAGHSDNDVIKITDIGLVRTVTSTEVLHLDFDVTVTDADGDATAVTTLSINPVTPPIALDLDGDGVEFVSGASFDYAGDGTPDGTAWVASDDGILVYDANGDRIANDASEIVFGGSGLTDLEGLAAKFDSNGDGVLDAADGEFAKFGVWQDIDSDGVTGAGEFRSLAEVGIVSISLKSDGEGYTAANGDVVVFGSSTYTKADGSTGSLADAAFATKAKEGQRTAEIASVAALAGAAIDVSTAAAQPTSDVSDMARVIPNVELSAVSLAEVEAITDHYALNSDPEIAVQVAGDDAPVMSLAHTGGETSAAQLVTAESHFDLEAIGPDAGAFDVAIAHGQTGPLFAGMAGDGIMAALLTMAPGQPVAADAPANIAAAIGNALSDFAGTAMVDAVVDHFAGAAGESTVPQFDAFDASFMLAQGLGGSAGISGYAILPDAHDDASALAAAQA